MAIGRPTKRTPEIEEVARRAMARGMSYKLTAELIGVTPQTFREWRKKDEDFSASLEASRASGIMDMLAVVIEKARSGDAKAAQWFLEKRAWELMPEAEMANKDEADSETQTLARRLHKLKGDMRGSVPTEEAA